MCGYWMILQPMFCQECVFGNCLSPPPVCPSCAACDTCFGWALSWHGYRTAWPTAWHGLHSCHKNGDGWLVVSGRLVQKCNGKSLASHIYVCVIIDHTDHTCIHTSLHLRRWFHCKCLSEDPESSQDHNRPSRHTLYTLYNFRLGAGSFPIASHSYPSKQGQKKH
jgi:hypothetical protein